MQKLKSILMLALWLSSGSLLAQVGQQSVDAKEATGLDAEREKHALQILAKLAENVIVSAAEARPTDKYGLAPTDGEFKGVRTFGQTGNTCLQPTTFWPRLLGEKSHRQMLATSCGLKLRTEGEILNYLKGSFAYLDKAIEAIGQKSSSVKSSAISLLKNTEATRLAWVMESLVYPFDRYGQMVEYLRTNGAVPPASRP